MDRPAVVVLLLLAIPAVVHGLKCYSCQSSGETDPRCEKTPELVPGNSVVNCNVKYCTIRRREFVDPPGRVSSFYRSCEERPLYTNKVVASGNTITYYRSCREDMCNSGDGVVDSGTGGGDSGWLDGNQGGIIDGGGAIIVPGRGSASGVVAWGCWIIVAVVVTRFL